MKVVLATGIYPPDIGGPATYVENLARELRQQGIQITVITYGDPAASSGAVIVSKSGGPFMRWWRYSKTLRKHAADADMVVAFSSVSVGIPLMLAHLRKPKEILRLGGDFFWERYTDKGGMMNLEEWHASTASRFWRRIMQCILRHFDLVVYSSEFQKKIHEHFYQLPKTSVIENPFPKGDVTAHTPHDPFHLLFVGRFVGFKNLLTLLDAMGDLPDVRLTIVGAGPMESVLKAQARSLTSHVQFLPPVRGAGKDQLFDDHDALIIPSVTEISSNVALEAVSRGLPVLLTAHGALPRATPGFIIQKKLRTEDDIVAAVRDLIAHYPTPASYVPVMTWPVVGRQWTDLFQSLLP